MAVKAADLTVIVTMQVPDDARATYPDAAIRAALTSLATRAVVPVEEQLALLPFKVNELAGFRVGGMHAGGALMLTDSPENAAGPGNDPYMLVVIAPGAPQQAGERDKFARDAFADVPNFKDVRLQTSEPLRLGGYPGHQIVATGTDLATGAPVTIVQWLRFGGGAYMQMIGVARTEVWLAAYGRFRQVRDGIEPR
jgi:hypothetical protein